MDAFANELMRRSPLAAAVLETCDFLFDDDWLAAVYDANRGRCYEDKLTFGQFLQLTRDALLRHKGSAHQLFVELEADKSHPIDESNYYRKLSRTPTALSRALLRDSAARLSSLMPATQTTLPKCFDGLEVFAGDGKTIKQVAARLKPARGYSAKLLGGKALIALNLRGGLAIAMTDLGDREKFPAADLLELYRHRWHIEQVFQQITQTFSLQHLIGCGPKATLFQLAYCLLLYNLTQVVKAYLARDGGVLPSVVSTFYLFQNMRKELEAWAYHGEGDWPRAKRDAEAMRERLAELLKGQWNDKRYTKASDKKPRGKPRPRQRLKGDHVSVQRVLEGRVEVFTE